MMRQTKTGCLYSEKMKDLSIPGIAVAVIKRKNSEETVYGNLNIEWNNKVTPHSAFQIASCTKLPLPLSY